MPAQNINPFPFQEGVSKMRILLYLFGYYNNSIYNRIFLIHIITFINKKIHSFRMYPFALHSRKVFFVRSCYAYELHNFYDNSIIQYLETKPNKKLP